MRRTRTMRSRSWTIDSRPPSPPRRRIRRRRCRYQQYRTHFAHKYPTCAQISGMHINILHGQISGISKNIVHVSCQPRGVFTQHPESFQFNCILVFEQKLYLICFDFGRFFHHLLTKILWVSSALYFCDVIHSLIPYCSFSLSIFRNRQSARGTYPAHAGNNTNPNHANRQPQAGAAPSPMALDGAAVAAALSHSYPHSNVNANAMNEPFTVIASPRRPSPRVVAAINMSQARAKIITTDTSDYIYLNHHSRFQKTDQAFLDRISAMLFQCI